LEKRIAKDPPLQFAAFELSRRMFNLVFKQLPPQLHLDPSFVFPTACSSVVRFNGDKVISEIELQSFGQFKISEDSYCDLQVLAISPEHNAQYLNARREVLVSNGCCVSVEECIHAAFVELNSSHIFNKYLATADQFLIPFTFSKTHILGIPLTIVNAASAKILVSLPEMVQFREVSLDRLRGGVHVSTIKVLDVQQYHVQKRLNISLS
jgi:hypothetical protein